MSELRYLESHYSDFYLPMPVDTRSAIEWLNSPDSDTWRRENFKRVSPALIMVKDEMDESLNFCDIVSVLWHA